MSLILLNLKKNYAGDTHRENMQEGKVFFYCRLTLLSTVICVYKCYWAQWFVCTNVTEHSDLCVQMLLSVVICVYKCYWAQWIACTNVTEHSDLCVQMLLSTVICVYKFVTTSSYKIA